MPQHQTPRSALLAAAFALTLVSGGAGAAAAAEAPAPHAPYALRPDGAGSAPSP